ncbi:PhnD/SsuA/transferrin family substrate-binding protein [Thiomicrospira sp. ALE5]|uniref:PhnD/SsuA/transferrin family substrate-binding protein n=1 Tax=Thiomicrospira sp. ALE5 TaxID=748650 RepID=UPI001F40F2AD|nr:PhnD/SsuA/transferrin family substrate-binding protein [Thiomicrospira sp. ALE5]
MSVIYNHIRQLFKQAGLLVMVLLFAGCQQDASVEPSTHSLDHAPAPGLVLAVPPYEMPSRIQQRFEPLVHYLSEVLNQPVSLYITHSYEDQIKRLVNGEVDLAYIGPVSYLKAQKAAATAGQPLQLIAAEAPYRAAVIVHENSDITYLPDLINRSIAFGSYHSYSGHFIIRQLLRLDGIYLNDLQFYSFLGRHERAIMSVVHQEFDAAATTEGIAQRFINNGYPIKIIRTSEFLAPTVIVASDQLPITQREKLIEALLFNPAPDLEFNFYDVADEEFVEVARILHKLER